MVYKVLDIIDNSVWAAKIIYRKEMEETNIISNIEQELRLMTILHHPFVLKGREIVYEEAFIALIIEYYKYGDLAHAMFDSHIQSRFIIQSVFVDVVEGLSYLHDRHICHKDIKADNILLTDDFRAMISDFGSTTCEIPKLRPNSFITVEYAPPEYFLNNDCDGFKFDIWSLGVLLFTLFLKYLPFGGESSAEVINRIKQEDIDRSDLPIDTYFFIKLCLTPDPQKRPNIHQIMENPYFKQCLIARDHQYPQKDSLRTRTGNSFVKYHITDSLLITRKDRLKHASSLMILDKAHPKFDNELLENGKTPLQLNASSIKNKKRACPASPVGLVIPMKSVHSNYATWSPHNSQRNA
jgi:serine/threonine protein kinase